ncbi:hypothetical protein SAMN05660860_03081 [Geoalkalibacter ferrihydriticus]|uniref:Uncharacterized protein n=2 Tax=Geoalkalibacter ferrihydriticus TaxID=392333 RepID=A0A0C2HFJ0_9BACT|nr:hypothetical protein [Geoalkalibacter ferrihydriticus]KIH75686.1 hypothetical protein GFER_15285 [Geoalkalibacter ferrihydriticus DSM 17813]SDM73643.1 hypothetical protein SAMN05660860_03081 [Geoalkalibacter ferrihydriticus]
MIYPLDFKPKASVAGLLFLLAVLLAPAVAALAYDPASSCVACHGDRERMRALGAESMYLDPQRLDEQIGMGGVPTCVDCHLGNPRAFDKDRAHAGMFEAVLPLSGRRERRALGEGPRVAALRWHDRELLQLIYRPGLTTNTCVRCHPGDGD